jgi:hypothetical protein
MSAPFGQDAQVFCPGPYTYQPLGCAQIIVTSTASTFKTLLAAAAVASPATSLITDVPTGARLAVMTVDVANVRWFDDGQNPTTAIGLLMLFTASGATPTFPPPYQYSGDLAAIKFIAASGSPLINVSFYK